MILSKKMVLVFTDLPTIFSSVKQPETHDPLSVVPLPSDVPPDGYKYNNTNGFSLFFFNFWAYYEMKKIKRGDRDGFENHLEEKVG